VGATPSASRLSLSAGSPDRRSCSSRIFCGAAASEIGSRRRAITFFNPSPPYEDASRKAASRNPVCAVFFLCTSGPSPFFLRFTVFPPSEKGTDFCCAFCDQHGQDDRALPPTRSLSLADCLEPCAPRSTSHAMPYHGVRCDPRTLPPCMMTIEVPLPLSPWTSRKARGPWRLMPLLFLRASACLVPLPIFFGHRTSRLSHRPC